MASKYWTGATDAAFGTAGNWSPSGAPTTGDHVVFDGRSTRAIDGSDQSAITLATLKVYRSCTFDIGSLTTPLKIGATLCDLYLEPEGGSNGSGPGLVALDFSSIQTRVTVYEGAKDSGSSGTAPIMLRGTHASNVLVAGGGTIGAGTFVPNEATTFDTIHITGRSATVFIGAGVTLTTLNQKGDGSACFLNCAATTINQDQGTLETRGSGAITTVNAGGTFIGNSTGTITTLHVFGKGKADFSKSPVARTVTNCSLYGDASLLDADNNNALSLTFTNGILCTEGAKTNQINMGDEVTVEFS